eukprot:COSAG03_NODE_1788_length_3521_cov_4.629006_3_plen_125_part_01
MATLQAPAVVLRAALPIALLLLSNDELAVAASGVVQERAAASAHQAAPHVAGNLLGNRTCTVRSGWTYAVSTARCGGNIGSATTQEACCSACQSHACCWGWTLNVLPDGNSCWLHGQPIGAPAPK